MKDCLRNSRVSRLGAQMTQVRNHCLRLNCDIALRERLTAEERFCIYWAKISHLLLQLPGFFWDEKIPVFVQRHFFFSYCISTFSQTLITAIAKSAPFSQTFSPTSLFPVRKVVRQIYLQLPKLLFFEIFFDLFYENVQSRNFHCHQLVAIHSCGSDTSLSNLSNLSNLSSLSNCSKFCRVSLHGHHTQCPECTMHFSKVMNNVKIFLLHSTDWK